MSEYVDKFISQHQEYFQRNRSQIETNKWDNLKNYEDTLDKFTNQILDLKETDDSAQKTKKQKELEKEVRSFVESSKKAKDSLFKSENKLTNSVLGRLSAFITDASSDRHLPKTQKFIDSTVEIIELHLKKCKDYLNYTAEKIGEKEIETDDEIEFNQIEVDFQDTVFNERIKIENILSSLNINNSSDNLQIKFYKNQQATIPMIGVFMNNQNYPEIRDITRALSLPKTTTDTDFFIHKKKVPDWNHKKHYWEQDRPVLDFWWNEYLKITNGVTIDDYHIHPWLYFHLNFFKTAIPVDGKVPIINPPLRDNELYFSELIKAREVLKNVGILIYGSRRISKALRNDQVLHYINGTQSPIGRAVIGDKIFGSDGKPTTIVGVYPQGVVDLYEVELSDGRKSICCDEHLWTVYDKNNIKKNNVSKRHT